jgi:hypothetical protein
MPVDALTGLSAMSASFSRESFGAQVVGKTLDSLNGASSGESAPVDKQTFGAQVVSKTLDYMNSGSQGTNNSDYDFQKDVLSAYTAGKGTLLNLTV